MTPNGSPSWKMIAVGLISIVVMVLAAVASNADTRMTTAASVNVEQDREIARLGADRDTQNKRLERIEAKVDQLIDLQLRARR